MSFALFNILVLVSRISNSFQAPLLAKLIESNLANSLMSQILIPFRWIILSASCATIVGGILIPSFQRMFSMVVISFSEHRSFSRLIFHSFSKGCIELLTVPSARNLAQFKDKRLPPVKILIYNIFAVAILTVGVLASLYAGYLIPELRVTCNSLSAIINGFATILMFVFIDPFLSVLTDDVIDAKCSESHFRYTIVALVISRFLGTLFAQLIFIPAAKGIATVSTIL